MKARFEGRCVNCGGAIRVGDEIVPGQHGGWEHDQGDGAGCPADRQDDDRHELLEPWGDQ